MNFKVKWLLSATSCLLARLAVAQSDHNNLDKERPLRFEDAYSIALGAREFQSGFRLEAARGSTSAVQFRSELQVGIANSRDLSLGWEPVLLGSGRLYANRVELSLFEGIQREIDRAPAIGYRLEVGVPVDGLQNTVDGRARVIFTQSAQQYDKLHLNLDAKFETNQTRIGVLLGYSMPLGYPTHFDTTLVAEVGAFQRESSFVGLGIRRQMMHSGVLDAALQWLPSPGSIRATLGYSLSF